MTTQEQQVYTLVHEWCEGQSSEIPDMNRRALMDRIMEVVKPQWIPISSYDELPDDKIWLTSINGNISITSGANGRWSYLKDEKPFYIAYLPYVEPEPYKTEIK